MTMVKLNWLHWSWQPWFNWTDCTGHGNNTNVVWGLTRIDLVILVMTVKQMFFCRLNCICIWRFCSWLLHKCFFQFDTYVFGDFGHDCCTNVFVFFAGWHVSIAQFCHRRETGRQQRRFPQSKKQPQHQLDGLKVGLLNLLLWFQETSWKFSNQFLIVSLALNLQQHL